jgi:hypothetical protein
MITKYWHWVEASLLTPKRGGPRHGFKPLLEQLEERSLLSGTDVVMEWNAVAIEAAKEDHAIGAPGLQFGPTRTARALAIESIAVFDAVNAIDGSYTPFLVTDVHASQGASIEAAAAQAAHDTLSALYPYLKTSLFDPTLAADLANIAPGRARQGSAVGQQVAREVLADRGNDGSQIDVVGQPNTYVYGDLPGQWRADPLHPNAQPLTPDWGRVLPFAVQSASQFGAPPPPSITSKEYADAYENVKALGGDGVHTPTIRTEEQTQIGLFWGYDAQPSLCAPVRFYNQIAEVLAKQEGNSEIQNARFFALVNVALADAGITVWNDKYLDSYWRPVTGIRENDPGTGPTGLGSGNPYLVGQGDPNWQPLGAPADNHNGTNFTPPFPSYTSGHAGFGGALFEMMKDFFGKDQIHFTIVSDEFNTITIDQNGKPRPLLPRSFDSFSQAAEENGQSRIYLGIHWEFDKVQGIKTGDGIADYVFAHSMLMRSKSSATESHGDTGLGTGQTAAAHSGVSGPHSPVWLAAPDRLQRSTLLGLSLVAALTPSQASGPVLNGSMTLTPASTVDSTASSCTDSHSGITDAPIHNSPRNRRSLPGFVSNDAWHNEVIVREMFKNPVIQAGETPAGSVAI